MNSDRVAFRLVGMSRQELVKHIKRQQGVRSPKSPNLSKWLQEAVGEKIERDKAVWTWRGVK